ncbi:MAG: hypothetical protein ACNS60_08745 [Candidatus Cyclobacteriaceae bacterium M2_1C_046]
MRTISYNPSPIEVDFAEALEALQVEIQKKLDGITIEKIENEITADNPLIRFHVKDKDGDPHEVVIKVIQKPDKF